MIWDLAIFDGDLFQDADLDYLNHHNGTCYSGPGRWFSNGWYWYRQYHRVIARRESGLDV